MQESDFDLKQLHMLVAENSFSLEKKQSDIIICVLLLVQEQGSVVQKKKAITVSFKEYSGKVP